MIFNLLLLVITVKSFLNNSSNEKLIYRDFYRGVKVDKRSQDLNQALFKKQSCISRKDLASFPRKSLLYTFKMTSLQECWKYCKFSSSSENCAVFVFHFITRACSLYRNDELIYKAVSDFNLAVGNLDCLECTGEIDEVVKKSKNGVLIVLKDDGFKKCLAVKTLNINNNEEVSKYQLKWKKCKDGDLWKLTRSRDRFGYNSSFRISKINSDLVLDWRINDDGYGIAFPNDEFENSGSSVHVYKANTNSHICKYKIQAFISANDYPMHLYTIYVRPYPSYLLDPVSFALPVRSKRCPIKQFSVENGKLLNQDRVPYFLPGNSAFIKCNPGFGVKALNYTIIQQIKCWEEKRPRYCSAIVRSGGKESEKIAMILVPFVLSTLLTGVMAFICRIALYSGAKKQGREVAEEVAAGPSRAGDNIRMKQITKQKRLPYVVKI